MPGFREKREHKWSHIVIIFFMAVLAAMGFGGICHIGSQGVFDIQVRKHINSVKCKMNICKAASGRTESLMFKFRVKQNVVPLGQKIFTLVLADVQFPGMNVVENIFLCLSLKMNVRRLYIGSITEEYLWK